MIANPNHYAIIMAGGIGSRFWPMSRSRMPKQFLDILGTGQTLIQSTWQRLSAIVPPENLFVVTNIAYVELVKTQLPQIAPNQILAEPMGRSTAPCIAYATSRLIQRNRNAVLVVSPADHYISDNLLFKETIEKAIEVAETEPVIVTLGIAPLRPDTGYGYIQYDEDQLLKQSFKIKTFTEKPNREIAQSFIDSGDFLWNSGIFIYAAPTAEAAFLQHLPDMYEIFDALIKYYYTSQEAEKLAEAYARCKNISFDYGILEKAQNVYVVKAHFGWSDLGTWNSLLAQSPKDALGNATYGDNILIYNSANNIIHTLKDKLVVLRGVDELIVVDTADVLLICHQTEEQNVREIVADIKKTLGDQWV